MSAATSKMVRTILVGAAAVLAWQAGVLVTPASAQYTSWPSPQNQDAAIKRAFRQVLNREPNSSELRRYRNLMYEEHWSEADIRDDLRSRSDYRKYHPAVVTSIPTGSFAARTKTSCTANRTRRGCGTTGPR